MSEIKARIEADPDTGGTVLVVESARNFATFKWDSNTPVPPEGELRNLLAPVRRDGRVVREPSREELAAAALLADLPGDYEIHLGPHPDTGDDMVMTVKGVAAWMLDKGLPAGTVINLILDQGAYSPLLGEAVAKEATDSIDNDWRDMNRNEES